MNIHLTGLIILGIILVLWTMAMIKIMSYAAGLPQPRWLTLPRKITLPRLWKGAKEPYRVQAFMTKVITGGDEVPYAPTYCLGEAAATEQYQALDRSAPPGHLRIVIKPVTMEEYLKATNV